MPKKTLESIELALRDYAMTFPEVTEDHPWGHRAMKVKGNDPLHKVTIVPHRAFRETGRRAARPAEGVDRGELSRHRAEEAREGIELSTSECLGSSEFLGVG